MRQKLIKERAIVVLIATIQRHKMLTELAKVYAERKEEIYLHRQFALYTIRIIGKLKYALKRKGPDFQVRTTSMLRHGFVSSFSLVQSTLQSSTKQLVVSYLKLSLEKNEMLVKFKTYYEKVTEIKRRMIHQMTIK